MVEILKEEVKQCSERQAQLHMVEMFFIQINVFLEVSAILTVAATTSPRGDVCAPTHNGIQGEMGKWWSTPEVGVWYEFEH